MPHVTLRESSWIVLETLFHEIEGGCYYIRKLTLF